ncbi:MAG: orotidine-5'-phosphate decarboxylase [Ignavibacteriaceae bacterium]|nr:orotidine-5'-phosphate decarboxylase [Ignavibacteriaceae bacterium]
MKSYEIFLSNAEAGRHVCVGLDTDITKIPAALRSYKDPLFAFNKMIIDATHDKAAAYKLNFAFYEAYGTPGFDSLKKTVDYIRSVSKDIFIIADAKRGDIGNTSKMYADSVFNWFGCDSITLHPYMGKDSLDPFFENQEKLNFVLALTSNKGSNDFEKIRSEEGEEIYKTVIRKCRSWYPSVNCGFVVGATNPVELSENLDILGDSPLLIPGVGAQGGDAGEIASILGRAGRSRFLINVSRSVIYASQGDDFAQRAADETDKLNSEIRAGFSKTV